MSGKPAEAVAGAAHGQQWRGLCGQLVFVCVVCAWVCVCDSVCVCCMRVCCVRGQLVFVFYNEAGYTNSPTRAHLIASNNPFVYNNWYVIIYPIHACMHIFHANGIHMNES